MTHTTPNNPADILAAIIAAGVAAYQSALPEDFRSKTPQFYGEPVTDEEAAVEFNVSQVVEERQRALCLSCSLPDCAGVENRQCPINIEARRLWRKR